MVGEVHYVIRKKVGRCWQYLVGADGLVFWTTSLAVARIQLDATKKALEGKWEIEEVV